MSNPNQTPTAGDVSGTSESTTDAATKPAKPPLSPSGLLRALQLRYALINMDGRIWVLDIEGLAARSSDGTATKLVLSNRSDGTLLLFRLAKALSPDINANTIVKKFFVVPETTLFDGVEFNPAGTPSNRLNLWVGPTVIPVTGDWTLIKAFLLDVICSGDRKSYDYLIGVIAHALQRPWEKPGILVILLGGQGIGKGTFGRILRAIWGATFLQVHNIDTVTGNFNASLERAFIVFLDEALFIGDRKASDALKSLVTEPVIHINEKHQPARQTHSYHRFFAATNADHLKNTDRDDRRDFVLRVSESHKNDFAYWDALSFEMEHGGIKAMVHELLAMDLSGFNVRDKPNTQELLEQKLQSLGPIPRWWHDCLDGGGLTPEGDWGDFIGTEVAINGIVELAGGRLYKKPSPADVVQALLKLCPSAAKAQQQDNLKRHRGLSLPSLQQARIEFEQYIGGAIRWDSDESLEGSDSAPAPANGESDF